MKKNGFTLVETLLVVAIIGLILAIAIPIIAGHNQKAAAQSILVNGLSQGQNPVCVDKDKGLYFFKEAGFDGLKAVESYAEEHTNLTLLATFSVADTLKKGDITPFWSGVVSPDQISDALSVKNGYFALFRSTE